MIHIRLLTGSFYFNMCAIEKTQHSWELELPLKEFRSSIHLNRCWPLDVLVSKSTKSFIEIEEYSTQTTLVQFKSLYHLTVAFG